MSEYEKLLQEKLRRHADVLRAWLAASSQASSSLVQIKLESDADTPPPPRTAEKVDELKSAVDLAIRDLAAVESITLPAAPASSAPRMTLYQTRFETDLQQYSEAMGAWVGALPQASSSGEQATSDPEADTTLACAAAPEVAVEGQQEVVAQTRDSHGYQPTRLH